MSMLVTLLLLNNDKDLQLFVTTDALWGTCTQFPYNTLGKANIQLHETAHNYFGLKPVL